VEPQDRFRASDLDRRERRWRQDLEAQARTAKRRLDDSALQARRDLDQRVRDARRQSDRPPAPPVGGAGSVDPGREAWQKLDDQALVWAVPAAAVASLPLLVGHLAAMLVHGEWPKYRLYDAPGILGRVIANPGDPGRAWDPVNTGGEVPGPVAWWGTFVFVAVIGGLIGLLVWAATRPTAAPATTGWARADAQPALWRGKKEVGHRLVLGVSSSGRQLTVRDRHSVLVVGPAHSGKSSGITVPAIVEWEGPVVVASTKGHLIDETIGWRSHQGEVHVYDPAAVTRYHGSGWSLFADCTTWHGAIRTAADLTLAARASVGAHGGDGLVSEGGGDLWRSSMSMSLAPFLLAAVSSGRSIGATAEWIEREERDEVIEVLQGVDHAAARAHRMTFTRPDSSRSAFLHAMHEILSVYEDPVVAASMEQHDLVPSELLDGGANTLYLTAPEHDQDRFRPLCAMIVRRTLAAAYEASARSGAPLDPPLLVVLDDVLSIAPIYDLASLASTAAARGVQIVSVFQDVHEIDDHYGKAGGLVLKNHGAKLVLPTGPSASTSGVERLIRPDLVQELREGEAALVYGTALPMRVRLRPWFRDRALQERVETPQDAVRPAERVDSTVAPSVADQSAAWMRRTTGKPVADVKDPTIPLATDDPGFVEVFGSLDDDTIPHNVTPLTDPRRRR